MSNTASQLTDGLHLLRLAQGLVCILQLARALEDLLLQVLIQFPQFGFALAQGCFGADALRGLRDNAKNSSYRTIGIRHR